MCEPEIKMGMPPPPISPSTPAPRSKIHPISPEISTSYKPEVVESMRVTNCWICGKIGHWACNCPLKTPNAPKPFSHSPKNNNNNRDSSSTPPPRIFCRCGHGFCLVKTSQSQRNPQRDYYVCPIKRGKPCKYGILKWCDDPIDESYMRPPPYKYPECKCGAGVCRKVENPVTKTCYFSCPVGKNHGSCGYRLSEEELLDNKSTGPIQQSILSFLKRNDLGERGDFSTDNPKRMRMTYNSESPLSNDVSELPDIDDAAPQTAPSTPVGFPEFEDADDFEVVNSVPWDVVEREACVLSPRSAPSRIICRQNLFPDHNIAGAVTDTELFGHYLMGWLGRLLFIHPTQGLKFPTPRPYFCCIFPSFDLIIVPRGRKQAITCNDPCENNQLAVNNLSEPPQLSNSCRTEASRDVVDQVSRDVGHNEVSGDDVSLNPIISQGGSQRRPMSKAERKRQLTLIAMQELLTDFESSDPHDHESMRGLAEVTFAVLDGLRVDYKHFSDYILDFINCASAVADIDKSMENSLSVEECNQRIEEERARFAQIQEDCVKTEVLLEASNQQRQCLCKEVSQLEAMLHEKQKQLNSCELESLEMETHLRDLKRRMVEADTTIKGRAEEAELAKRLNEDRQTKQMAAKAALEKAKLEVEN